MKSYFVTNILHLLFTAGSVMYEHGMRLSRECPGKRGLQRQAQCYLAAMNALRLVDPDYAWIVKPVPPAKPKVFSITFSFIFSSPDPKVHVRYCHHLASGVCRPSVNFFKHLL